MSERLTDGPTGGPLSPVTPTSTTSAVPPSEPTARPVARRPALRVVALLLLGLGLGAAAGVVWWSIVPLPTYRVNSDGGAATTERGLAAMVAGDAWFCALGMVVGVLFGMVAWWSCRDIGWRLVPVVVLGATAAALVCWLVGYRLGPGEFAPRLAAAKSGEYVPVELTLRAQVSLVSWPFFAVVPVLLGSSLGRDEEEARPVVSRRSRSAPSGPPSP